MHERLGDIMQVLLLLGLLTVAQGRKEAWAKNRAKQEEMEMKAGNRESFAFFGFLLIVGSDDASGDLSKGPEDGTTLRRSPEPGAEIRRR